MTYSLHIVRLHYLVTYLSATSVTGHKLRNERFAQNHAGYLSIIIFFVST